MATPTSTATSADGAGSAPVTQRHPIRGFLYGIFFGLGLALIAIGQKWAALGTWPPILLLVGGVAVGTLWSTVGPAKAPEGPAPVPADRSDEPAPLTAEIENY